jgi:hypothetical protein
MTNEAAMRCDQCKYWPEAATEWEAEEAGMRQCRAVRQRWDIADEASEALSKAIGKDRYDEDAPEDKFVAVRKDALQNARAYVQDGSQFTASFWTMPDFFCALFQTRT